MPGHALTRSWDLRGLHDTLDEQVHLPLLRDGHEQVVGVPPHAVDLHDVVASHHLPVLMRLVPPVHEAVPLDLLDLQSTLLLRDEFRGVEAELAQRVAPVDDDARLQRRAEVHGGGNQRLLLPFPEGLEGHDRRALLQVRGRGLRRAARIPRRELEGRVLKDLRRRLGSSRARAAVRAAVRCRADNQLRLLLRRYRSGGDGNRSRQEGDPGVRAVGHIRVARAARGRRRRRLGSSGAWGPSGSPLGIPGGLAARRGLVLFLLFLRQGLQGSQAVQLAVREHLVAGQVGLAHWRYGVLHLQLSQGH
mmetsp:Transcript_9440/g.24470  ORF Transcript_9440/g.24470 Transcript_9440/m.24470 type:complete len:305 (+) Transcript_9440:522-1436(+)